MKSKIKKIQTAFFLENFNIGLDGYAQGEILTELGKKLGDIFNKPIIIPVPDDAPAEIPRIVLKSENNSFSCNISKSRVDIFFNIIGTENIEKPDNDLFETQIKNALEVFSYLEYKKMRVNRIGFVADMEYDLEPLSLNGAEFIRTNFLGEDVFRDSKELLIRYNEEVYYKDISFNKILTMNGRKDNNIINTQVDVNNIAFMTQSVLSQALINDLMKFSVEKIKESKKLFEKND